MRPAPNSGPNSYSVVWCSSSSYPVNSVGFRRKQQQAGLGAGFDQCLRQGAHDVGQATRLDQRKDLRGHMQHLHAEPSFTVVSLSSISRVTSVMPCSVR